MRDFFLILYFQYLRKMKMLIYAAVLSAVLVPRLPAQQIQPLNQTDSRGLKQGHWIRKNSQGHTLFDGFFTEGKPAGLFRRFYDNDSLQSVLDYKADGKTVEATFYHRNGFIESKGTYLFQKKEGNWEFYSAVIRNFLLCREEYRQDLKNGLSEKFYPDGTVSEKIYYENDRKSGEWTQYYPDGKKCLSGNYKNGQLEGSFSTFYDNGDTEFAGQYKHDARDGEWTRYNTDGSIASKTVYTEGRPNDPDAYKKESDYLDSLERNKGKIADPEKTGTLWQ